MARQIYVKLTPCNLGTPQAKARNPLKLRGLRSLGALGSLGKSRVKFISDEEPSGVAFNDFAGQEYINRELQEIVRILKNKEEFQNKGIYCPKGVMLHGSPGTGKALLSKAIASEAGVPFFAASGTDFVEVRSYDSFLNSSWRYLHSYNKNIPSSLHVGIAASRVKDLFTSARSFAPSIIFIDEIDAVGRKCGGPDVGGGGAEREQGLLQILTEMDGFKVSTSQVHARNKFFQSEVEKGTILEEIVELAVDFTGAELQNVLSRDSTEVLEELQLRLSYREAVVPSLACYYPDPHRLSQR
ncbi:hypothetical protein GIB67_024196 [Kingdonia uniflora]|uniref:AAA+ ATPase domain-containing protein n=1 Tax=Kingdonia uniflora TaxID=39325 RepID=A0A7J7LZF5_9MAGN|nr:hypothetical protein GIB67_024196 [Kingdonia uniflora]